MTQDGPNTPAVLLAAEQLELAVASIATALVAMKGVAASRAGGAGGEHTPRAIKLLEEASEETKAAIALHNGA